MIIKNNKLAHRGVFDNQKIPENSLKAFEKAMMLDYSIELDIQLTKDDVFVVFHDESLERMTGEVKKIHDLTLEEIKRYSLLDTKEKIPTLQEVFHLVKGKVLINIEVKEKRNCKKVCKLLMEELKDYSNYILQSFNPFLVRTLKKNSPNLEVGYLMGKQKDIWHLFLNSNFMIRYSKADFLGIHKDMLKRKKFQKLKKNYTLFLWTIKKTDNYDSDEYVLICNDLL